MAVTAVSAVAATLLACACLAATQTTNAMPVEQTYTGKALQPYTLVELTKYLGILQTGAQIQLTSNPPDCLVGCFTDVAAPYPDKDSWVAGSTCIAVVEDSLVPQNAFIRPESLHLMLYKSLQTSTCDYSFKISGNECESSQYGPNCESPQAQPNTFTLQPGESFTFKGPTDLDRYLPSFSIVKFSYESNSTDQMLLVAGRSYDYPRILNFFNVTEDIYDNITTLTVTTVGQNGDLEVASPPSMYLSKSAERTPLFWSFMASPDNTDNVTITISDAYEAECETVYQGGRDCKLFLPEIYPTATYKINWFSYGAWSPYMALSKQSNFSIGITATSGKVHAYLRYGNVATSTQYDIAFPLIDSTDAGKSTRYYFSGSTVDTQEAAWYATVISSDPNEDATYYFWLDTACPGNCGNQGTCLNHQCTCADSSLPPVTCAEDSGNPTTLPDYGRSSQSTRTFFIVWGVFCGLALIGLWVFLHRRRSQIAAGYNNL